MGLEAPKTFDHREWIFPWLFIAPPGTGKSWTLGSMMEVPGVERGLLLAPKPREADSYLYRKHKALGRLDVEVFRDIKWAPVLESYGADAYDRLFRRVLDLYEDEKYDVVLLDPLTDACTLLIHKILSPARVGTPGDLEGKNASVAFYGSLKNDLRDFTQSLVGLSSAAAKRPKHVLVAIHAQPVKEENLLEKDPSKRVTPEGHAKGVSFLGEILPSLDGSYRQDLAGEFSVVGFNGLKYEMEDYKTPSGGKGKRQVARYVVQLNADPERHAKAAIVPRLAEKEVPNSMVDIFRVIEEASR